MVSMPILYVASKSIMNGDYIAVVMSSGAMFVISIFAEIAHRAISEVS